VSKEGLGYVPVCGFLTLRFVGNWKHISHTFFCVRILPQKINSSPKMMIGRLLSFGNCPSFEGTFVHFQGDG